jgi:hypothetical protein
MCGIHGMSPRHDRAVGSSMAQPLAPAHVPHGITRWVWVSRTTALNQREPPQGLQERHNATSAFAWPAYRACKANAWKYQVSQEWWLTQAGAAQPCPGAAAGTVNLRRVASQSLSWAADECGKGGRCKSQCPAIRGGKGREETERLSISDGSLSSELTFPFCGRSGWGSGTRIDDRDDRISSL